MAGRLRYLPFPADCSTAAGGQVWEEARQAMLETDTVPLSYRPTCARL